MPARNSLALPVILAGSIGLIVRCERAL